MTDWDSWQRSLPQAPHIDASQIRGTISAAEKQLCANVFAFYTTGSGVSRFSDSFGSGIAKRLRIVELNSGMTTTAFAMVLLGRAKEFDGAGVSTSMNVSWHNPAPLGSKLIITTRSVYHDGRARMARCQIRDKGTGKLIVSGTHALVSSGNLKATTSKM
ncbi:hypothetical protein C8R47DRAFT_1206549 [Mycena vitilis]|nr:hypothetical protein C8R47DRAFT_1206549 [Mycena vitilis]